MSTLQATISLNCDLGEGLDDIDRHVMPHLHQANIACGGHAGDTASMARTLQLAKQHGAAVGAHPSYPDRDNFGRTSMIMADDAVIETLTQQVSALADLASHEEMTLSYIKPHGALYNDCAKADKNALDCLIAVSQQLNLPLMLLAGNQRIESTCKQAGVTLIREAFADRGYLVNGQLVPRTQEKALLEADEAVAQVVSLKDKQGLFAVSGEWLELECESVCVHSDTERAVEVIKRISSGL